MPHESLLYLVDGTGLAHVASSRINVARLEDSHLLILGLNETQHHLSLQ